MGKATRNATVYPAARRSVHGGHMVPPYVPEGWMLVPIAPTLPWIEEMGRRTSYPQTKLAIELVLSTAPRYGAPE